AVADMIAAGSSRPVAIVPSARHNPVTHRHFDITNLLRAFPDMRFTSLAEGLAATFAGVRADARGSHQPACPISPRQAQSYRPQGGPSGEPAHCRSFRLRIFRWHA